MLQTNKHLKNVSRRRVNTFSEQNAENEALKTNTTLLEVTVTDLQ